MANLIIAGLVMTDATLEQHNAGNDHGQRRKPLRRQMFGEQDMADDGDADDAEPLPDRIGDRHRNDAQRQAEKSEGKADQQEWQKGQEEWR